MFKHLAFLIAFSFAMLIAFASKAESPVENTPLSTIQGILRNSDSSESNNDYRQTPIATLQSSTRLIIKLHRENNLQEAYELAILGIEYYEISIDDKLKHKAMRREIAKIYALAAGFKKHNPSLLSLSVKNHELDSEQRTWEALANRAIRTFSEIGKKQKAESIRIALGIS